MISGGTTIGDLHQIVKDRLSGKTYHAKAKALLDSGTITPAEFASIKARALGTTEASASPAPAAAPAAPAAV